MATQRLSESEKEKLKAAALVEYKEIVKPAHAEYERIQDSAYAEYEKIEAHAKAIVKLNKVLDKLDRLLSQRKLNEYR